MKFWRCRYQYHPNAQSSFLISGVGKAQTADPMACDKYYGTFFACATLLCQFVLPGSILHACSCGGASANVLKVNGYRSMLGMITKYNSRRTVSALAVRVCVCACACSFAGDGMRCQTVSLRHKGRGTLLLNTLQVMAKLDRKVTSVPSVVVAVVNYAHIYLFMTRT